MKLQDQVCTIEQGKQLKELGILQQSVTCFIGDELHLFEKQFYDWAEQKGMNAVAAFTVSELGAMLPDYTVKLGNLEIGKCETDHVSMKPIKPGWWNVSYWTWSHKSHSRGGFYLEKVSNHLYQAPTAAQAMAAMLIYLIQKKLVKVKEINERLQTA